MLAELHVSGRALGSRKIEAARCEGLTEALAVTIAMVLDQEARESSGEANTQNAVAASEHSPSSSITAAPSTRQTSGDGAGNAANNPAQHPTGASATATANAPATSIRPAASPAAANVSAGTNAPAASNAPAANTPATASTTSISSPRASAMPPAMERPTGVPAASSTTPPGGADQPSSATTSAAAATPDPDIRTWLGAGAGSSNRWHFEIGGEYGVQGWALQLGAFFQPIHEQTLGTGKLQILSGGGLVAGCRRFGMEFRFAPCVRASLGMERVDGEGFDQERVHTLPVATLGPVVGVEAGRKWILGLDLVGEFALTPRIYRLDNYVERRTESVDSPLFVLWLVARMALSSGK